MLNNASTADRRLPDGVCALVANGDLHIRNFRLADLKASGECLQYLDFVEALRHGRRIITR
jgi:hypothetical protein